MITFANAVRSKGNSYGSWQLISCRGTHTIQIRNLRDSLTWRCDWQIWIVCELLEAKEI